MVSLTCKGNFAEKLILTKNDFFPVVALKDATCYKIMFK